LRKSEQQFRTLADTIPNLACMAHANGEFFWFNQRWYDYTGATPQAMEDGGWQSVHDPAVLPAVLENWSESVVTEVIVFVAVGPFLLRHMTPEGAMSVSAVACLLRWGLLAQGSSSVVVIGVAEPLHGLTFALLHLSCMRVLANIVPRELAGVAQAIYGTVGVGLASAAVTLASGSLYADFGTQGFWAMSLMAAMALPAIWRFSRASELAGTPSLRIE